MKVFGQFLKLVENGFHTNILGTAQDQSGIDTHSLLCRGHFLILRIDHNQLGLYDVKDLAVANPVGIFRIIKEEYPLHPAHPLMKSSLWCLQYIHTRSGLSGSVGSISEHESRSEWGSKSWSSQPT